MAHLSGDPDMLAMFAPGQPDFFRCLAARTWAKPLESVTQQERDRAKTMCCEWAECACFACCARFARVWVCIGRSWPAVWRGFDRRTECAPWRQQLTGAPFLAFFSPFPAAALHPPPAQTRCCTGWVPTPWPPASACRPTRPTSFGGTSWPPCPAWRPGRGGSGPRARARGACARWRGACAGGRTWRWTPRCAPTAAASPRRSARPSTPPARCAGRAGGRWGVVCCSVAGRSRAALRALGPERLLGGRVG